VTDSRETEKTKGRSRPDFHKAKNFMLFCQAFEQFIKDLRRRGKWMDFQIAANACVDGDEVDIHGLRRIMVDFGYDPEIINRWPKTKSYPEGWQFKEQYANNPEMPASLSFVWNNLQNVPPEYINDKMGTYEKYKNLFLVHPWDAPDFGSFNMLCVWAKKQSEFYRLMTQSMIYSPEAIGIFKPQKSEYHQLASQRERAKKTSEKGKKSQGEIASIALEGASGTSTGTYELLERAINESEKDRARVVSNKKRPRVSTLFADANPRKRKRNTPPKDDSKG